VRLQGGGRVRLKDQHLLALGVLVKIDLATDGFRVALRRGVEFPDEIRDLFWGDQERVVLLPPEEAKVQDEVIRGPEPAERGLEFRLEVNLGVGHGAILSPRRGGIATGS